MADLIPEQPTPKVPETPTSKPVEIKAPEIKPLGQTEQRMVDRIDEDGNPDLVLQDLANTETPQSKEPTKTSFKQFLDEEAVRDRTPLAGGEMITPTAVRVDDPRNPDGSVSTRAAQERGWLSAVTSAYGKKELPESERQRNVQDIVDAAIVAGVPKEQLGNHLQSLGINTVARGEAEIQTTQPGATQQRETGSSDNEAGISKSLDYVNRLAESVLAGNTNPSALQNYVDYSIRNGVPRDRIEAILQAKGINVQKRQENQSRIQAGTPTEIASRGLPQPPYEQFARQITIDAQRPPRPESLIPPIGGNMVGDNDRPTLAGRAVGNVYDALVKRPDHQRNYTPAEIIERGKQARQDFVEYIEAINKQRETSGLPPFKLGNGHESGSDGFHFDGKYGTVTSDHLFYFNKSHTRWKNPRDQEIRGYVTLGSTEIGQMQRQFVDLATQMYDAGIDFTAKAVSPLGAEQRTDNMVFYISQQDQPRAAEIMKRFMTERGLGQDHVAAAMPSPQEGLSWAMEPTQEQKKIWQEVSGSSQDGSFNAFVATMAMPVYLERLAEAQERVGNTSGAQTFRQEAQRVKQVIASHNQTTN